MAGVGSSSPLKLNVNLENGPEPLNLVVDENSKEVTITYNSSEGANASNRSKAVDKSRNITPPGTVTRSSREPVRGSERERSLSLRNRNPNSSVHDRTGKNNRVGSQNDDPNNMQRLVEKIEDGIKAFLQIYLNQQVMVGRERNSGRKDDKLEREFSKLRSEIAELRRTLRQTSDNDNPLTDEQDRLIKELSAEFDRIARRSPRSEYRRDLGTRSVDRDNAMNYRSNGNAINRLRIITNENKRLLKDALTIEKDLINLQNDYMDKFDKLQTEQDVLVSQLSSSLGVETPLSDYNPTASKQPNLFDIAAEMEDKGKRQQETLNALKTVIEMIGNQLKIKDKEIMELRAQYSIPHHGSVPQGCLSRSSVPLRSVPQGSVPLRSVPQGSVPQVSVPQGSVPLVFIPQSCVPEGSVLRGPVPESSGPQASVPEGSVPQCPVPESSGPQASVPEGSNPNLRKILQMKDLKMKFISNSVKQQYEKFQQYLSSRSARSSPEEMRDVINVLYGHLKVLLDTPEEHFQSLMPNNNAQSSSSLRAQYSIPHQGSVPRGFLPQRSVPRVPVPQVAPDFARSTASPPSETDGVRKREQEAGAARNSDPRRVLQVKDLPMNFPSDDMKYQYGKLRENQSRRNERSLPEEIQDLMSTLCGHIEVLLETPEENSNAQSSSETSPEQRGTPS